MFFSSDSADHYTRSEEVFIFAHNNGSDENIHNKKEISFKITDETKCKVIQTGGGSIAKNVREFKMRALQYYNDHQGLRFPPSYYLPKGSTRQFAEQMEKYINNDQSCKILVDFDPTAYLTLLGLEENEQKQIIDLPGAKFDNIVIVVNTKKRWIMVTAVTDSVNPTTIMLEMEKVDGILKAIFWSNRDIKNIVLIGVLSCQEIESHADLKNHQPAIRYTMDSKILFATKDEMENRTWLENLLKKINAEMKGNCKDLSQLHAEPLETLTGSLMCSMSQTQIFLPKVTYDIPTKLSTILLNSVQIESILHPARWKILKAPFGGGKTVLLSEIAKKLLQV